MQNPTDTVSIMLQLAVVTTCPCCELGCTRQCHRFGRQACKSASHLLLNIVQFFDLWMHTDRSNSIRSITCIAVCGDDFTLRRNDMHGEKIGFMLSTLHLLSALLVSAARVKSSPQQAASTRLILAGSAGQTESNLVNFKHLR
jgi:hypothetical protein